MKHKYALSTFVFLLFFLSSSFTAISTFADATAEIPFDYFDEVELKLGVLIPRVEPSGENNNVLKLTDSSVNAIIFTFEITGITSAINFIKDVRIDYRLIDSYSQILYDYYISYNEEFTENTQLESQGHYFPFNGQYGQQSLQLNFTFVINDTEHEEYTHQLGWITIFEIYPRSVWWVENKNTFMICSTIILSSLIITISLVVVMKKQKGEK